MKQVTKCLILSERSYCVFVPQGFVIKCFLIFIINEVKNFAANIFFKLVSQSCTRSRASLDSHVLGSMQKGWRSYIEEFRGSEAIKGFCCKFIYGDCKVQGQMFCTRSKASLYYSELLFGKVSFHVFSCETSLFHWLSQVIISCLIYFSTVHDIDVSLF